jgi:hypothetical protein
MKMNYAIKSLTKKINSFFYEYEDKESGIIDVDLDLKSKDFVDLKNKYIFLLCFNFIFCGYSERDYNRDNRIQISTLIYDSCYCSISISLVCFDEGECQHYVRMPMTELKGKRDKNKNFWPCTGEGRATKYESPQIFKCLFELALLYCLRKRNVFYYF